MKARAPDAGAVYEFLDRDMNDAAGGSVGFTALVAAESARLEPGELAGFVARHAVIRRFHASALEVFLASLRGDVDPGIAASVLGDAPAHLGREYHLGLRGAQLDCPRFFRTDEPAAGVVGEIQCPGSAWSMHEQLRRLHAAFPGVFPEAIAAAGLPERFVADLRACTGADPVIHLLMDNASMPGGARYFLQALRAHGARFYGWDRDVTWRDCNFVRSHDWVSLANDNFHRERLEACAAGRLWYDLPPCALFDSKLILAWPFDVLTRGFFDDAIRAILPYAALPRCGALVWADGSRATPEQICSNPGLRREMYVKYAGTDVNLNWGSRGVFYLGNRSATQARGILDKMFADGARGRPWIVQQARRRRDTSTFYTREGEIAKLHGYRKTSAFYGPSGLYGVHACLLRSAKVHGTTRTVYSLVS